MKNIFKTVKISEKQRMFYVKMSLMSSFINMTSGYCIHCYIQSIVLSYSPDILWTTENETTKLRAMGGRGAVVLPCPEAGAVDKVPIMCIVSSLCSCYCCCSNTTRVTNSCYRKRKDRVSMISPPYTKGTIVLSLFLFTRERIIQTGAWLDAFYSWFYSLLDNTLCLYYAEVGLFSNYFR